jgi:hypothetical protein
MATSTALCPSTTGADDGFEAMRTVSLTAFLMQPVRRKGRSKRGRKETKKKEMRGENLLKEVVPLALPFPELFSS